MSSDQAFSGASSMAISVTKPDIVFASLEIPDKKIDTIIGNIYLPKVPNIEVVYMGVCGVNGKYCSNLTSKIQYDRWFPFVMDLSQFKDDDGVPFSDKDIVRLFIQGKVLGTSPSQPYTFYVDGIEIYPSGTP